MMRENEAVVLNFTFPDELESYNKYIEFETNKGSVYDWIFDDKYELPSSITKFSSVTAQIVCRLDTIVWKSNTFSLKFSKSVNAIQASDDRIDTIGEIINTLKQEIEIVETLTASINQTISDIKVSLANGEFIGDKGDTGDNGEDGQSAYLLWLELGNEGSEEDFIASLKGEQGEKGEQGDGVVDYDIINSYIDETTESKISDNLSELETMVNTNTTNIANKVDKEEGKGLSTEDYTTTEKNKLSSIEESANNYTLPTATSDELGGVKVGSNLSISDDGVLSVLTQDLEEKIEQLEDKGTWVLLAENYKTTWTSFTVEDLSQYRYFILQCCTYGNNYNRVLASTMFSYEQFVEVKTSDGMIAKYSDSYTAEAYYVDDTTVYLKTATASGTDGVRLIGVI